MFNWKAYVYKFFIFWYIWGVVLVGFDLLPSKLQWSNSVFIITSGVLAWIYFCELFGYLKGTAISSFIFLTTFVIEYYGSSFAFLFGHYTYTNQFAPNILGVPIAIGFAWMMVIATAHALLDHFSIKSTIVRGFLGGLVALTMDLVLDPVAYLAKEYWIWHESGVYYHIPWTNFFGWFIVAFAMHFLFSFVEQTNASTSWQRRMILLYSLILAMFALIALMNKLYVAAIIGFVGATFTLLIIKWRRGETLQYLQ